MLVMCRALPDKVNMPAKGGMGRAGMTKARRGREGGSAGAGSERGGVLTRVVELETDAIFRVIVEFLWRQKLFALALARTFPEMYRPHFFVSVRFGPRLKA